MHIEAKEISTNIQNKLTVCNDNRLTKEDIDNMMSASEKHKEEDTLIKETTEAKLKLEHYILTINKIVDMDDFKHDKKTELKQLIIDITQWMEDNDNPMTKTDYIEQYKLLYEFIQLY